MGGESRKQRKRMPVLPVAGGELTLQAGQVTADRRLMCMITQLSKAQTQRAYDLFPESRTESFIFLCVCCLRREAVLFLPNLSTPLPPTRKKPLLIADTVFATKMSSRGLHG